MSSNWISNIIIIILREIYTCLNNSWPELFPILGPTFLFSFLDRINRNRIDRLSECIFLYSLHLWHETAIVSCIFLFVPDSFQKRGAYWPAKLDPAINLENFIVLNIGSEKNESTAYRLYWFQWQIRTHLIFCIDYFYIHVTNQYYVHCTYTALSIWQGPWIWLIVW